MVLRLIDKARPRYQNSSEIFWKSLNCLPITHFLMKSNYKLLLCSVLRVEAIKERKYFMYNCALLNGNKTREKKIVTACVIDQVFYKCILGLQWKFLSISLHSLILAANWASQTARKDYSNQLKKRRNYCFIFFSN